MTCPACRARFRAVLVSLGEAHGVELLTMAQQLDPSMQLDAMPLTPSTFEQRAEAVKRAPSGTMQAVRIPDTDPAPAPTESER